MSPSGVETGGDGSCTKFSQNARTLCSLQVSFVGLEHSTSGRVGMLAWKSQHPLHHAGVLPFPPLSSWLFFLASSISPERRNLATMKQLHLRGNKLSRESLDKVLAFPITCWERVQLMRVLRTQDTPIYMHMLQKKQRCRVERTPPQFNLSQYQCTCDPRAAWRSQQACVAQHVQQPARRYETAWKFEI